MMLLITGATGFIGRHLVERLGALQRPARCLIRKTPAWTPPPGIEFVSGDLSSGSGLEAALEGVDAVIHLAGATKVLRPSQYYEGNVRATETLLRALRGRDVRLVHVSSLAAIGPGDMLTEEAPAHPVSHYGRSKLEAERVVRAQAPGAVIVRPPVVYGPRDTDVFHVLKSAAQGLSLEVSGGGEWFSAIYVGDLVEGLLAAASSPAAGGRDYFLAHPKPASWRELCAEAARIMGRRPPATLRVPYPLAYGVGWCAEMWSRLVGRPGIVCRDKISEARYSAWTCSAARAAAELGFMAGVPLPQGLARTLAWYKENGWLRY
jgi:dihydroflavonol-4-reductase